jgi:O-antigen ligase
MVTAATAKSGSAGPSGKAPPAAAAGQRADSRGATRVSRASVQLRLAGGLLVLLALVLPFEVPLFRLGPLQITSVELVLYAMLAAWGLGTISTRPRVWPDLKLASATLAGEPIVRAVVLWSLVLFASAATAPSYRAAAVKFALRGVSGVLAFFAARELARSPKVGRRVVWGIGAGALLSAGTAVVEWLAPGSASVWKLFRGGDFGALGLPRPCGVFAFPTIGAMYWEAAVPLLVVAPFLEKPSRSGLGALLRSAFALLACALLSIAILASATRSGLAGAAIACAAVLGLVWRSGIWVRSTAAGALGVLALTVIVALTATGHGSLLGQRLRFWHDDGWFRVEYVVGKAPRRVHLGETLAVPVTLRNTGTVTWQHDGDRPFRLSYHWVRLSGPPALADYEGLRTALPADVPPGGVVDVVGLARGPADEGEYRLHWDLVEEGVTWFSEVGNAMPEARIDVLRAFEDAPSFAPASMSFPTAVSGPPSRWLCWQAAVALWREHPLLGVGPDNFRRLYPTVLPPPQNAQPHTDTRIHANSLYFETLADLGLAGAIALALIARGLVRSTRAHWKTGRLAGLGCGVAAGAFFVHGALDYFFEFTPLFGLFWVVLGLTAARSSWPAPPDPADDALAPDLVQGFGAQSR